MKTINEPANPPANNEKPKNNITLACHAVELEPPPPRKDELLLSLSK